jgi:glutamine cyclotransferase
MKKWLTAFAIILSGCLSNTTGHEDAKKDEVIAYTPPLINYGLKETYPHDTTAFTEGFLFHNGQLFESTGAPEDMAQTRSLFGSVNLSTGRITPKAELDRRKLFGEGITFLNNKVYQLTYQSRVGFVYDAKTFKQIGQFAIPTKEGWGMTTDGMFLIMSDGTQNLSFLNAQTLNVDKTVTVTDDKGAVSQLNELEFINGFIYANIYTTNRIVKIDPNSGKVVGRLDLTSLAQDAKLNYQGSLEMNGIAYDSASRKVLVTGKMWPHIYAISFSF